VEYSESVVDPEIKRGRRCLKKYRTLAELRGKWVATPGKLTTVTLLFKIYAAGIENVDRRN
jgi:predicted solute-binding protein